MPYQYLGQQGLISLPGRTVSTFPSGLVRVDRQYVCRASALRDILVQFKVGNRLPMDDGSPSLNTLAIFPEVQTTIRGDGFAEISASAYGQAGFGTEIIVDRVFSESLNFETATGTAILREKNLIIETVLNLGDNLLATTTKIPNTPVVIQDFGIVGQAITSSRRVIYRVGLTNYTVRNFGKINEVVGTYGPIKVAELN